MKCFVVFVVAAISLSVEGSIIPWYWPGPVVVPAPAGLAIPGSTVVQSNPPAVVVPALPAPVAAVAVDASGVPTVVLAPAPAVVVAAPAPAATSVSATRGAVHVAPLPGHSVSQQQLNLAPAPGSE
ncbi:adult cuticle protein 1-like [Aedes albopictus]|uniref:Cuticle protein n=1 Tax=Aedes albopictus TaxID=7160 RepID=A0ABM1XZZ1_AEDAL|nr:adult cuticle protein 1-like [Aedes albopictus]